MEIQIKELLLEGRILDHVKRNWGKYGAGATAAGLGTVYAAGQGVLGIDAQDAVQDFGGEYSHDLENASIENKIETNKDAAVKTLSRRDNVLTNWDENRETFENQKRIQPDTYIAKAQDAAASGIRKLTNMEGSPDTANFIVRNPSLAAKLELDRGLAYVNPYLHR